MAVNPVNSGNNYVSQVQPKPQSYAERTTEKENTKVRENAKQAEEATRSTAQPTVNTNGQAVGTVINVKA